MNRSDGLGLRIDDRVERIIIHPGESNNLAYFGWDCADDAAIDEVIGRLIRAEIATTEESELAALRQVERLVSFTDPFGFRHELTTGLAVLALQLPSPHVGAERSPRHRWLPSPDVGS